VKLSDITPYLIYDFKTEHELTKSISEISHNFTQAREDIDVYVKDERLVAAYTCFYLLTNIPKLTKVFEKIDMNLIDYADYEFVDIGAGPGTFSLALLKENPEQSIIAIEKSELMIKQGHAIVGGIHPKADFKYYSSLLDIPTKTKKRFGIFGHSANEMSLSWVQRFVKECDLDLILFIEPGTKEFFKKSLELRTRLTRNFYLNYPCLCSTICPLPEGDWCHQYLNISHEKDVERLTQLVQKDRRSLPIIINLYSKSTLQPHTEVGAGRIVRVYKPTKFSQEWQVCVKSEKLENQVIELQIMNRGYTKSELKELRFISAGDKINFTKLKDLSDNNVRGKLI